MIFQLLQIFILVIFYGETYSIICPWRWPLQSCWRNHCKHLFLFKFWEHLIHGFTWWYVVVSI